MPRNFFAWQQSEVWVRQLPPSGRLDGVSFALYAVSSLLPSVWYDRYSPLSFPAGATLDFQHSPSPKGFARDIYHVAPLITSQLSRAFRTHPQLLC